MDVIKKALREIGWHVAAFRDPKDALESLKTTPYEAVFCDEQVRGASPAGLLTWVRRLVPELPFYLFSNDSDSGRFRLSGPPTATFHFPPVAAQLPLPQGTQSDMAAQEVQTPLSGNTSLVSLTDVIEMMSISKQQGVVQLDGGGLGFIVVNGAKLEHAVSFIDSVPQSGLQALAHLMNQPDSEFRVVPYKTSQRPSVNLPVTTALTEAARIADESTRFTSLLSAIQTGCPQATAVAVGYPMSSTPSQSVGDNPRLFAMAKSLFNASQDASGERVKDMLFVTDKASYVLNLFGDNNLVVAQAPVAAKAKLYRAVHEALKLEPA